MSELQCQTEIVQVPVDHIEENKFNPNVMPKEEFDLLKQDMKDTGKDHELTIDPILISPIRIFYGDPTLQEDRYVVVDGKHRWQSAKEIVEEGDQTWTTIPARIRPVIEAVAKALNYRKNKERGHLDPLLEAQLFASEIEGGLTQKEIAEKYNVSRPYVGVRLSLTRITPVVTKLFREPEKALEEIKTEEYEESHKEWQEQRDEAEAEDPEAFEENEWHWNNNEPDEPTEEDFVPRVTLSTSHLEPISTLPEEEQNKMAIEAVERGYTVRDIEEKVKKRKEEIAKEARFQVALEKAKRPKCPQCGADPQGFGWRGEETFKCGGEGCYNSWEFMKTQEEADAEQKTDEDESTGEEGNGLADKLKEARENPSYIRLEKTPQELHERTHPWILRKLQELTSVEKITVIGKRGDEEVSISYQPPGEYQHMDLEFKVNESRFGFNVQAKTYKKKDLVNIKSRVDMGWGMERNQESRDNLKEFFDKTVETDEDPVLSKREELLSFEEEATGEEPEDEEDEDDD